VREAIAGRSLALPCQLRCPMPDHDFSQHLDRNTVGHIVTKTKLLVLTLLLLLLLLFAVGGWWLVVGRRLDACLLSDH
jgi:hypothetical protein